MAENYEDVKDIIRSLILSSKEDLTIRQLCYDYTESTGEKIPFLKMGFNSVEKFLQSMPDVLYFTYSDNNIMKVRAICTNKSQHIKQMVNAQKRSNIKSNNFARTISNVVEQKHKKISKIRKNLENKNEMECSVTTENSRFPKNDSQWKTVEEPQKSEAALPMLSHNDPIFLIDLPLDVSVSIPPIELPSYFRDGFSFILDVTAVHNPNRFWFHEVVENNHPLDSLMYELNIYYNQIANELYMEHPHIYPGICCAIHYKNKWYRAEVLEFVKMSHTANDEIKVFCVDYGTFRKCKISSLKYLKKNFSKLPRQALRGELSGIRRIKLWNSSALNTFITILNSGLKTGTIIGALSNNKICRLNVIVSNEETGSNDFLKDLLERSFDHIQQEVEYLETINPYDYPPFEIIEKGKSSLFKRIHKELENKNMTEHIRKHLQAQLNNLLIDI